jgi:hypothetical protein
MSTLPPSPPLPPSLPSAPSAPSPPSPPLSPSSSPPLSPAPPFSSSLLSPESSSSEPLLFSSSSLSFSSFSSLLSSESESSFSLLSSSSSFSSPTTWLGVGRGRIGREGEVGARPAVMAWLMVGSVEGRPSTPIRLILYHFAKLVGHQHMISWRSNYSCHFESGDNRCYR